MKISYLINTYPRPSHTFIRREIQALERQGFEVHRFAMRSDRRALVDQADKAEDKRTEHLLENGRLAILQALFTRFFHHPLKFLSALRIVWRMGGRAGRIAAHMIYLAEAARIAQRCDEEGIRHIHAHFGTNSATVACLARALGGPPWSYTVHGPEEFDAPVGLSIGEKSSRAAFTVAVSTFGRSQLCRWTPLLYWRRLRVVHCGIEPSHFPEPTPLPEKLRLVAIGRFSGQKGLPLLIEAIALAVRMQPGLHITLVGDGELRGEIEAMIEENTLRRHITLTGWLAEDQVRQEIAAARALILPSFAEGLPLVVIEAMAAGRPVIATAIAGLPELVTPDCGWLVPAGDAASLAGAIDALAKTPAEQLTRMGQAARSRALLRHDADREAAKLAQLIRGQNG